MKSLIVFFILSTSSAFANNQLLTQALLDNAQKLIEVKAECTSGVRSVKTTKVDDGHYVHSFTLVRNFRGQPGKDCEVAIFQDLTPTYVDGAIAYDILVKEI